jgi:predicted DNA binding CopG/RHH family protein
MKPKKILPKFESEAEEREFWRTHDFSDYASSFEAVEIDLSDLKPTTKPVTLRLPLNLIVSLKELANKKDVPYQSLMKVYLDEKVREDFLCA